MTDHRFLGGAGRWRDSGMMGRRATTTRAASGRPTWTSRPRELLGVIREVRPQVLVSYDANGFYGHPDHIQATGSTRRAFDLAGGLVAKLYARPRLLEVRRPAEAMALARRAAARQAAGPTSPRSSPWTTSHSGWPTRT